MDTSGRILFLILALAAIWLLLDQMYGQHRLKGYAGQIVTSIKGA